MTNHIITVLCALMQNLPVGVNSRVMFTTHRRLMCTSHSRTYVYRSGAVEGLPHLGCRQG